MFTNLNSKTTPELLTEIEDRLNELARRDNIAYTHQCLVWVQAFKAGTMMLHDRMTALQQEMDEQEMDE